MNRTAGALSVGFVLLAGCPRGSSPTGEETGGETQRPTASSSTGGASGSAASAASSSAAAGMTSSIGTSGSSGSASSAAQGSAAATGSSGTNASSGASGSSGGGSVLKATMELSPGTAKMTGGTISADVMVGRPVQTRPASGDGKKLEGSPVR